MTASIQILEIFLVFLKLGFISLGGVFGVLPELERMLVIEKGWVTHEQFIHAYVMGQFVPGPNMAMCPLIGYQIAGWPGWAAGFLGIYTGPVLIMGAAYAAFTRYKKMEWVKRAEISVRPVIAGLLLAAAVHLWWIQTVERRVIGIPLSILAYELYRRKILSAMMIPFLFGAAWWSLEVILQ